MKVIQFTIPVSKEHTIIVQEDKLPYFYNHLHRHNEIQLTLIIRGQGTLIAGNYMRPFSPGEIYVIGSNQPHIFKSDPNYFTKKTRSAVHALTLFFDPVGVFKNFLFFPEAKFIKKLISETTYGLKIHKQYETEIGEKILALKELKEGFLIAGFIDLIQTISDKRYWKKLSNLTFEDSYSELEGLRMNDVYQYTLSHYTENIPLKKIADVACMTPQAFCRYFKKHTRRTFVNFLNEIRINEACKIMNSGNFQSVQSVAYETGFNSAVSFNRVFKRVTSKSPREYMKEYADLSSS